MNFLFWLEQSALGLWVRESLWGFPISLSIHSLAMGFLVGINFALGLRMLGIARQIPLAAIFRFKPMVWACAAISLLSGLMLLAAYPAKALTNGVFYFKLLLVALGLSLFTHISRKIAADHTSALPRWQAPCLLLLWAAAVTAGRFLAYTHHVLSVSDLY